jgi:NAD(P)-dependent dehydrogenase (short-subunit alcohol dehydrogenase family)
MMNINLDRQVALVTGAGRGIGEAIGHKLAANGAHVIYSDIDYPSAERSASKSKKGTAMRIDVTNFEEVESGISQIEQQFGRLDIVVNNAGINSGPDHRVNIDKFDLDEWQRVLSVDLNGVFIVSKSAAGVMLRKKSGRIINISSVLGVVPARLQCAFVAAKSAVVSLTRTMAIELGSEGIAVNCVAPGTMNTLPFYKGNASIDERGRRLLSHVPMGRPGTLDDVAFAVLYFCAPESAYVTGQVLCVDGGWTAGGFFRDF